MASPKKFSLTSVKGSTPAPEPIAPEPSTTKAGEDRKLITLRLTYAQRRYLQKIAFDEETTVQEWIVAAIDARLEKKGLGKLASVKD